MMNREEIENRIEVCEVKANGYREVGNSKLADKYENEKYKWEKLLSDLELLNERKITELLEYKKGYFNLEQENKDLKEKLDCDLKWALKYDELFLENKELKEKINTYEDPEDLTLMFMYCNEKAKDKIKELHNKIDILIGILKTWKDYCKVNHKNSDDFDKEHWSYCIEKLEGLEEILKDSDVDE